MRGAPKARVKLNSPVNLLRFSTGVIVWEDAIQQPSQAKEGKNGQAREIEETLKTPRCKLHKIQLQLRLTGSGHALTESDSSARRA